jgi:hypothetical protein
MVGVPTTSRGVHGNVPVTPVLIKTARVEGAKPDSARQLKPKPRTRP